MAFFLDCCDGKGPDDFLLVSDKGKVWQKQHTNHFRRAVARARLPRAFVFHGLHHTYTSDLVKQGVPIDAVARQLGHADTRTVSATYGHLAEHFREEQVRTRLSPLSAGFQDEVTRRASELSALWNAVHGKKWRDFAAGLPATTMPLRSRARTQREVLEVFGD